VRCAELLGDDSNQPCEIQVFRAGEEIDRCHAVLGPRVQGKMRLRDHDDPAHALRGKSVKVIRHDRGTNRTGGIQHCRTKAIDIVEQGAIAVCEIDEEVSPEKVF